MPDPVNSQQSNWQRQSVQQNSEYRSYLIDGRYESAFVAKNPSQYFSSAENFEHQHGFTNIASQYDLPDGMSAPEFEAYINNRFSFFTQLKQNNFEGVSPESKAFIVTEYEARLKEANLLVDELIRLNPELKNVKFNRNSLSGTAHFFNGVAYKFNPDDINLYVGRHENGGSPGYKLRINDLNPGWHVSVETIGEICDQIVQKTGQAPTVRMTLANGVDLGPLVQETGRTPAEIAEIFSNKNDVHTKIKSINWTISDEGASASLAGKTPQEIAEIRLALKCNFIDAHVDGDTLYVHQGPSINPRPEFTPLNILRDIVDDNFTLDARRGVINNGGSSNQNQIVQSLKDILDDRITSSQARGDNTDVLQKYGKTLCIDPELGNRISAHGMKDDAATQIVQLVSILTDGLRDDKTLYTTELERPQEQKGFSPGSPGTAYRDGLFMLISDRDCQLTEHGIAAVLVNPAAKDLLPVLQEHFPSTKFVLYTEINDYFYDKGYIGTEIRDDLKALSLKINSDLDAVFEADKPVNPHDQYEKPTHRPNTEAAEPLPPLPDEINLTMDDYGDPNGNPNTGESDSHQKLGIVPEGLALMMDPDNTLRSARGFGVFQGLSDIVIGLGALNKAGDMPTLEQQAFYHQYGQTKTAFGTFSVLTDPTVTSGLQALSNKAGAMHHLAEKFSTPLVLGLGAYGAYQFNQNLNNVGAGSIVQKESAVLQTTQILGTLYSNIGLGGFSGFYAANLIDLGVSTIDHAFIDAGYKDPAHRLPTLTTEMMSLQYLTENVNFQHDAQGNRIGVRIRGINDSQTVFTRFHERTINTTLQNMAARPTWVISDSGHNQGAPLDLRVPSIQHKTYADLADRFEWEQMLAHYGVFDDQLRFELDPDKRYTVTIYPHKDGAVPPDPARGERYGGHLISINLYEINPNGSLVEGTEPVAFDAIIDNEYAPVETTENIPVARADITGRESSGNKTHAVKTTTGGAYETPYHAAKAKTQALQAMLMRNNKSIVMTGLPAPADTPIMNADGTFRDEDGGHVEYNIRTSRIEKKVNPKEPVATIKAALSKDEFGALGTKQGEITVHDIDPSTIRSQDPANSDIRLIQFSDNIVKMELTVGGKPDETSTLYIRGKVGHVKKSLKETKQFRKIIIPGNDSTSYQSDCNYNSDRDWFSGPDMGTQFKIAADPEQSGTYISPGVEVKVQPADLT